MEELRMERQRRIAERTASSGLARAAPKKDQIEGKTARLSAKSDKNKTLHVKRQKRPTESILSRPDEFSNPCHYNVDATFISYMVKCI